MRRGLGLVERWSRLSCRIRFAGFGACGVGSERRLPPSHELARASLSPASRVGRVPRTSSGSPGRTRPTGFMGRVQVRKEQAASHES
ncbi:MAG: hypothetical protein FJ398_04405 [Verrucomicrobia bacterium]|nr:hypothetical protein [Verrucomicrobiota bacterium]